MSDAGLTENGFIAKRLPEIQQDIVNDLSTTFGEVDTSADSVFGQIVGVLSKPLADLWEQMQQVYNSQYPDTADGVPLDYAVALTGITRQPATFSQGEIGLKGTEGSFVSSLSQVSQKSTNILFQTKADTVISATNIPHIYLNVDEAVQGNSYELTIDAVAIAYTALFGETEAQIAQKIVNAINTSAAPCMATALNTGAMLLAMSTTASVTDVSSNMSWFTPASIVAVEKGKIPAPVGSIIGIVNAVSGLDAVYNFISIDAETGIGRDIETDTALRLRRLDSLKVTGAASVEAIRARILAEVAEVSACIVLENFTDAYDYVNLMDPHSIKVIVAGGVNLDIGKMIWKVKAGGIRVVGGVGAIYTSFLDSQGNTQVIPFFRPTTMYAYVNVDIVSHDPLLLPTDYAAQLQSKIYEWGKVAGIGKDMIYQELFGIIYQVPGIIKVDLTIALMSTITPPSSGDWKTDNIAVASTAYAEYSTDRIEANIII